MGKYYNTGSNLLGLKNCRDKDTFYLSDVADDLGDRTKCNFSITREELLDYMKFDVKHSNLIWLRSLYMYDSDIIKQNFPVEFHILNYREEVKQLLNELITFDWFEFNKNGYCDKRLYHIRCMLDILKNNSVEFTAEQLEIIQQIHDERMPISYKETIKVEIKALNY